MNSQADLLLVNGKIYTVDETCPWAEAVAIRDGRIIGVGDNKVMETAAGQKTRRIDLDGRLVLPGLCDAHIHLYDMSMARRQLNLFGCQSKGEMIARVRSWAADLSRPWIIGRGWNEISWLETSLPTAADLDPITGPDTPAILWRSDMHAAVVNSAALALAGIDANTPDPDGGVIGRDADGRPSGLLWELAINRVMDLMPRPSPAELMEALSDSMVSLNRLGITAVHDQRMKDQDEGPMALDAYQRLRQEGRLTVRINCNIAAHNLSHLAALGLRSGMGDDYLRLGHVKLFADGTMGSRTAWMLAPFEQGGAGPKVSCGVNVTSPEQMIDEIRRAAGLGFPASVHAIGDRSNRVLLDIFEELAQGGPQPSIPHRIEHVQIIHPDDVARLAQVNVTASVQPIHALDDMETAEHVLGSRAERTYNFNSLAQSGARLALGSDAPVADYNPFLGIHAAVCRQRPAQMALGPWYGRERLSLEQTIAGYTIDAARAAGWEGVIGSISPGKRADLVVLDQDLFKLVENGISGTELAETQVVLTVFDGRVVYEG